ncbi:ABC transporter permease [Smaragdicoccus niigatensis]
MINVLNAERIKLTSVKSPKWCAAIIVFLSISIAALVGWVASRSVAAGAGGKGQSEVLPNVAAATNGVSGLGVYVLMILAALTVTSEYRFGVIRSTFQATPNRSRVLVAKAILMGSVGAVLTLILALLALGVSKVFAGEAGGKNLVLSTGADWRAVLGIPLFAALCAILGIGVGALVRQTAAAVAILILFPLLIESLFLMFGSFGEKVLPFLPFRNATYFLAVGDDSSFHWGHWGAFFYFAAMVFVVFGAAILVVQRRDA